MGIRMVHRRTPQSRPPAKARSASASAPVTASASAPALAVGASSARIPADLAVTLRRAATRFRRRLRARPDLRRWFDLARSYLALLLAALPGPRRPRTMTVFVASLTERPKDSAGPRRPPAPDATP
ncbi:MAG: hypothetical protein JF597_31590 [Streptomyces sp.]|uniref:hypothetical protein n=1 Tax=Streptomyces sp. TaxID=1931 RepID=UPI0025FB3CF8|nr:hypothetical protein [Streptomyces sp.]MBW8797966.1 hypothetical protein [Streptomyces sp.]